MPLEKAYIEVLTGFGAPDSASPSCSIRPNTASSAPTPTSRPPCPGLGSPLIQFVNGDAATLSMELVPRRHDRPGRPARRSARRHRPRREEERQGPHRRDHGAARHRPRTARAAAGALRLGAAALRCGAREGRAQDHRCSGRTARRRARALSVAFREYRPLSREAPAIRLELADKTKRRQISASESIWLIADKEYGDPRGWRVIAEASDVDDPRALRPGDWLRVPPLEEADGSDRPF